MTDSQRRMFLVAAVAISLVQLFFAFRSFLGDAEGRNFVTYLPLPLATLAIGLAVWAGRGRSNGDRGDDERRGRVMKGPWQQ